MKLGITLSLLSLLVGCGLRKPIGEGPNVIFLVPGVSGDNVRYNGLIRALRDSECGSIRVVGWGAPAPLFFMNFSTQSIHNRAEADLARLIEAWRAKFPDSRIDLIGHSAGCGVILGALPRVQSSIRVDNVVLLAPSVSPDYPLQPALQRVNGTMQIFVSDRDTLFLKWRTCNFGTYDRIKTPAAGNMGFNLMSLPEECRDRVVQHKYDPAWQSLGNRGGHFGALSEQFVAEVVIPLLHTSQSSEVSGR